MIRKNKLNNKILLASLVCAAFLVVANINKQFQSASLTTVSVTLSNARPSFRGGLAAGNTVGTSLIYINTTPGAYPSTTSAQLVEGDALLIGEGGSLGSYVVASTSSNAVVSLKSILASGDADAGDSVIASTSSTLSVRFLTASAIANGSFRILVPALTDNGAAADGIPDSGYFDFGTVAPTITCPTISGYTWGTATAVASSVTINNIDYHAYTCPYTGTGGYASDFVTNPILISSVINPAPKTNHSTGTADTYQVIVQHLDGSSNIIDSTTTSIGVIEAVRVTASVPPQITFRIFGVPSGTSVAGTATTVTTQAAAVPFGEVSIDAFTVAAQGMSVSTNASGGYVVTAIENDQLGRNGAACAGVNGTGIATCIPDAEVTSMDSTTTQPWTLTANKGFAYTLDDSNSTVTEAFAYASGFRHFADEADSETAVTIFSDNTVADNDNLYVLYKIVVSNITAAGNYENFIRYTATATF